VKVQKFALPLNKPADVKNSCRFDAHPPQRRPMRNRGNDESSRTFKTNEAAGGTVSPAQDLESGGTSPLPGCPPLLLRL
jgi:hypothetical protein